MRGPRHSWPLIASASIVKTVIALVLMAIFFVLFFLAPAPALAFGMLAVLLFQLVRPG